MAECEKCSNIEKIIRMEDDIKELRQKQIDSESKNSNQHKEFYENIQDIKLSAKETQSDIRVMGERFEQMIGILKTVQEDLTMLRDKPSKKLDSVTTGVIVGILVALANIVINYVK